MEAFHSLVLLRLVYNIIIRTEEACWLGSRWVGLDDLCLKSCCAIGKSSYNWQCVLQVNGRFLRLLMHLWDGELVLIGNCMEWYSARSCGTSTLSSNLITYTWKEELIKSIKEHMWYLWSYYPKLYCCICYALQLVIV